MPVMDGLEVTRRLNARAAPPGVDLLKNSGPAQRIEAVWAVVNGESLMAPVVTVRLLAHIAGRSGAGRQPAEQLTECEKEVVVLVARGATNQELGRSRTHRRGVPMWGTVPGGCPARPASSLSARTGRLPPPKVRAWA
ncbi:hypothetical protein [Streptomyces sp. NPDC048641]|uniref:hypothetical protein n=1 Tax=unclassified Streptomyces TaxID=2593676 RepID=UPI0034475A00